MERVPFALEDQERGQEAPQPGQLLGAAAAHNTKLLGSLMAQIEGGIDHLNSEGLTMLHLAVLHGNVTAIEVLLCNGADVEATAPDDRRPLHMAVDERSSEIVQVLLRHNALPDAKAKGLAPLHSAVMHADIETIRVLLEFGANVNAGTDTGRDLLLLAVHEENASIVKLLLNFHADPNKIYAESPRTALHLACNRGKPDIVKALLDHGANPNVLIDGFEGTPLFQAVASGSLETTKLLLQRGAKTHVWRSDGQSILDLAAGNQEILNLLEGEKILQGPRIRGPDEDGHSEQSFRILRPHPPPGEGDRNKTTACHGFDAFVMDFFTEGEHEQLMPQIVSVHELLYSDGPEVIKKRLADGSEPSFTWYHLPSNNMIWTESLIRRIAAERGNVSAEVYANAKMNLELSASEINAKPQSFAAPFSTMRPHCRRVPGRSIFPLTNGGDGIVSFVPFLHFETYKGNEAMNEALKKQLVEQTRRPIFEVSKALLPPLNIEGRDTSPTVDNLRRPILEVPLSTPNSPAGSSNNISTNSAPERGFGARVEAAFKSLNNRISYWAWRKPHPNSGSAEDTDLETGSVSPDNNRTRLEMEATIEPKVESEQTQPMKRELESALQYVAHNSGSGTDGQETHHTIKADDPIPIRESTLDSANGGPSKTEDAEARVLKDDSPTRLLPLRTGLHNQEPGQSGEYESNDTRNQIRKADTKMSQVLRKNKKKKHRHPLPSENLHQYLIRGYFSPNKQEFQPRRTLDQYVYGHIETTSHCDDDQVVYRYAVSQSSQDPKIIMVDQLWLWILGDDTIISCSPLRWESWLLKGSRRTRTPTTETSRQTDFRKWFANNVHQSRSYVPKTQYPAAQTLTEKEQETRGVETNGNMMDEDGWPKLNMDDPFSVPQLVTQRLMKPGREAVGSVRDLAGLITTLCVELLDPHHVGEDFLFFEFFERPIVQVNETLANYLREFKEAISEEDYQLVNIAKETELMIEIEVILDELHTLKLVLTDQKTVIKDLNRNLKEITGTSNKGPSDETRTLENNLLRIEQMEVAAKKAEKLLHRLMDLERKQASLSEALYARKLARDTAKQGKTVIVFTVVTILFLPVSFIAAIFAIDTNGFPLDRDGRIPFDYLMKHILAIGLGISIVLITIAFNVDRLAQWLRFILGALGYSVLRSFLVSSVCLAVILATLGPVWTSELTSGIKAAVSIAVAIIAFVLAAGYLIYRLNFMGWSSASSFTS